MDELARAEERLAHIPEYNWLTQSNKPFWTVAEIAENLHVSINTVKKWCSDGDIQGAVDFGGSGWRMPRSGVVMYLASRLGGSQASNVG